MKRLTFVAFVVGLIALAAPSIAQQQSFMIELDGYFTGPTDSVQLIGSFPVPTDLVGASCTGTGQLENNASVHPDNDLIIITGDVDAEITDFESEPGAIIPFDGNEVVVLGETIDFFVRFGGHAQTSLGLDIVVTCAPLETTTTTTTTTTTEPPPTTTTTTTEPPLTTTTTEPPTATTTSTTAAPETTTTAAPTTTTSSAPLGGVGAGAGGTADNDALGWFALGAAGLILAGTGATAAWRMRGER